MLSHWQMTMSENQKKGPEWHRVKFGDVVQLCSARCTDPLAEGVERYVGLEHLEPGDLRIRNWGNVADGVTFTSVFQPGQVLFGKRRAYQRKVAVADFSGVCSGDIYVMETRDAQVLMPELLSFICQTDAFFDHAVGTSAGSLSPRTNWTSLANFEFSLPPQDEQGRLVNLLRAIEAERDGLFEVKAASDELISAIGKDVLENNPAPRVRVGTIAKFASGDGISVSLLSGVPKPDANVPVYGGNGIAGYTTTPLSKVPHATVVIGRVGAYCGQTYFVEGDAWISDNALFTTSISDDVLPSYLAMCLTAANLNRKSTGGAQPLINQQIVKAIEIPVPELQEQLKIVEILQSVSFAKRVVLQRSDAVNELKQMVLKGEHSV